MWREPTAKKKNKKRDVVASLRNIYPAHGKHFDRLQLHSFKKPENTHPAKKKNKQKNSVKNPVDAVNLAKRRQSDIRFDLVVSDE